MGLFDFLGQNVNLYEKYLIYYMPFLRIYFFPAVTAMLLCVCLNAQDIPDSLSLKLANAPNDSVKVKTWLMIGESIEATSIEQSLEYYHRALTESRKMKNGFLELSALTDIGIACIERNKLDSAIVLFEQAVGIAEKINDTLGVAKITANIGNVFLHKQDRVKAIEYYMKSAGIWEKCADQTRLSALYSNICSLLTDQAEYTKAIEYGDKAVELSQRLGDNYSAVNALVNLSTVYGSSGQPEKQRQLLDQSLPLAKKGGDLEQASTIYFELGDYYFKRKEYKASLDNYLESHAYALRMDNQYHVCTTHAALALCYLKLGDDTKAMTNILLAEDLANKVGARADLKDIYQTRGEIEQKKGNYKLAAEYFQKRMTLSDSLFKAETSEKIADVEAKYQNEKKQQEILQLEKDKKIQALTIKQKSSLNYILIGSVAALLLVGFLGYRNLRHRHQLAKQQDQLQQQRISELEKDRQLVAVDSMLKGQEEERSRLAKDLHDGLGGLLSGVKFSLSNMKDNLIITPDNMTVFERSLDMIDTSIKELRRVAHNMMPEMLVKFGLDEAVKEYCNIINSTKLVTVKYQALGMETRLEKSTEIIIFRIVQELLNNVMKHAAATTAFVQLIRQGDRLNLILEDDGKGFDTTLASNHEGAGLLNIRSRVDYLKGRLDIHSEPGKGTLVNIEFNV